MYAQFLTVEMMRFPPISPCDWDCAMDCAGSPAQAAAWRASAVAAAAPRQQAQATYFIRTFRLAWRGALRALSDLIRTYSASIISAYVCE